MACNFVGEILSGALIVIGSELFVAVCMRLAWRKCNTVISHLVMNWLNFVIIMLICFHYAEGMILV
jgi:hypothetical protein